MYKYFAFLALMIMPCYTLIAQETNGANTPNGSNSTSVTLNSANFTPPIVKQASDFVMLQFGYNNWIQKPDTVKTKGLGYTFAAYLCYDFPIKKTNLSFATGLGVLTSVIYLDQQAINDTTTITTTTQTANVVNIVPGSPNDKRYKFVTTYIKAPFELRYFGDKLNRNKGFKAAIGLDIGTLLGAHTKEVQSIGGTTFRDKVDTKRYVSPWDFAATGRVGWGNFSFFASYNLTYVFKSGQGPLITPASVGICITGL